MHILLTRKKDFLFCLGPLLTKICFCQTADPKNISDSQYETRQNNFGVEIIASILPPAKITRQTGRYELGSHLQSSFDIGINYLHYLHKSLSISTGLHFIVGKRNFFINIPPSDLTNSNPSGLLIEQKELWGSLRIPLLLEKKISNKRNPFSIKTGLNFRYSGLMSDESFVGIRYDSNNRPTEVFNAEISARNNGKPWITFLGGFSKSILLGNKNVLTIGIQADISTTYFLKGSYKITIPNQPITSGTYEINGSSLGLSVQYIFTGSNKQVVKPNKTAQAPDTVRKDNWQQKEDIFKKYVFKGNHIQFNFGLLSTFKAQLKETSGNHAVSSSATAGLLVSFKYQINFNDKYSLITGTEATLLGRNFNTSFSKYDFSPPLVSDYSTKGSSAMQDLVLSLPVMLEKRWLYSNRKFLFADAGLRFNFGLGADLDIYSIVLSNTANGIYEVGGVNVYANNNSKPWISFPINAGHAWLLKNNNLLQLAICSNISFTKYVNGKYHIDIPNQPLTEGDYSSTGSFIGLSLNYIFTNANYHIRKAREKQDLK